MFSFMLSAVHCGTHFHKNRGSSPVESHISFPPSPAPQAAVGSAAAAAPPPSYTADDPTVFDVRKYGAVGDGLADDTEAFKAAWDSACGAESTTLLVPHGHSFLIQSIIFTGPCRADLVVQIDGTIVAPDGPGSWPQRNGKRQWLIFYRIHGLSMQGGGVIDGRGDKWWDLPCKPHKGNGSTSAGPCDSPVAIRFFMSSNLKLHELKSPTAPSFTCASTDAATFASTGYVPVHAGDDCVSIGAGCFNVDIRNISCGPSRGISIGSLGRQNSHACVSNITMRDSVIRRSANGVRIKTWQGGSGAVSGVTFNNIHMDMVRNPIIVDQYYCLNKSCANQTSAVYVSDVSYSNIKGTYDTRSQPMQFACSDAVPCTNLTLSEVELLPAQGEYVTDPVCWNAYGTMETPMIPPAACILEGTPEKITQSEVERC
ncbi:hypothetical protein MLD38_039784 [Melastoma candidum]|uniref:Uncharacterized protein n=1 Tax=Melastoma candidum TaxID=119954 RepID=A0ACB9L3K0_9MYRT|nr:hypothetical protein MLD38_039784 [Melastoma candidum]